MGFEDNILVARVFNISETKEMSELLNAKDLTKRNLHKLTIYYELIKFHCLESVLDLLQE